MKDILASKCPYGSEADVEAELKQIVLSPQHIMPYAKAMQDARLAKAAKEAWDAVYQRQAQTTQTVPTFAQTEADALIAMKQALADGTWRDRCKGREVLKALCGKHSLVYEHFRNVLISKLAAPPAGLASIMNQILARGADRECTMGVRLA
jgi:hypothetical protein